MKTAALPDVQIGQIWQDNDPRLKTVRLLRVTAIATRRTGPCESSARCTVLGTQKQVWIKVRRFRPTSTGYKLVEAIS